MPTKSALVRAGLFGTVAGVLTDTVVTPTASFAVTEDSHNGKVIALSVAGGLTATLPASTGSGVRYKFVVGVVSTTGYVIQVANASDIIQGSVFTLSDNSAAVLGYMAGAADDTITLNGTTKGGVAIGDWVELTDLKANVWTVRANTTSSGTEATPFSAAV